MNNSLVEYPLRHGVERTIHAVVDLFHGFGQRLRRVDGAAPVTELHRGQISCVLNRMALLDYRVCAATASLLFSFKSSVNDVPCFGAFSATLTSFSQEMARVSRGRTSQKEKGRIIMARLRGLFELCTGQQVLCTNQKVQEVGKDER